MYSPDGARSGNLDLWTPALTFPNPSNPRESTSGRGLRTTTNYRAAGMSKPFARDDREASLRS